MTWWINKSGFVCRGAEWKRSLWVICVEGNSWESCEYFFFVFFSNLNSTVWRYEWLVNALLFFSYRLVTALTLLSKKLNCYKVTLECAPRNVSFYQKFGYGASDETYMQCRFFDWRRMQLEGFFFFQRGAWTIQIDPETIFALQMDATDP